MHCVPKNTYISRISFITRKFLNRGFTEEHKVLIKVLQLVQRDFFKNFQTEINANYFEPKSGNGDAVYSYCQKCRFGRRDGIIYTSLFTNMVAHIAWGKCKDDSLNSCCSMNLLVTELFKLTWAWNTSWMNNVENIYKFYNIAFDVSLMLLLYLKF